MAAPPNPTPSPISEQAPAITEDGLDGVIGRANRLLDGHGGALPTRLNFGWRGMDFKVERKQLPTGAQFISVEAVLGRLPYSAENAAARIMIQDMARNSIGRGGGRIFRIGQEGRVLFRISHQEEDFDSLPTMLKRISLRMIEVSDKLEQIGKALVQ